MYFDAKETGDRIRSLRKSRKITQEGLAEILGVSQDHIGKVEVAINGVSIDLLIDIAVFFDVSLDYLIMGRKKRK
ncbi:MAG: helix-turn-helix transcriptional regulator [Clostridiales bacterium]|nr:helix-turn-helix transcriptional regulator [Clostridiales bacterium]